MSVSVNYSRPHIAPAVAEDCYILAVFYLFLFPTTYFSTSLGRFLQNFAHDAVCPEIFDLLYGCSCVPLKTFEGQKTQYLPICGPKIDNLSPIIPYCGENQET